MTLTKLVATDRDRDVAQALAGALQDLLPEPPAALSLFETGDAWQVEAYFAAPTDALALNACLAGITGRELPPLAPEAIPDVNWVALSQAALPPVHASRITVHGTHDRWRVPRGPTSILIDAGEAFGTAHHATTYGCLEAIGRLAGRRRYRNVLDLGCGSGVLAIAAARLLPRAAIIATDIDLTSTEVARGNVAANGVASRITVCRADGVADAALRRRAPYDLVMANILAGPLVALARPLGRCLAPKASLILSGLLTHQAAPVAAAYRAAGCTLVRHTRIAGWSTLELIRR